MNATTNPSSSHSLRRRLLLLVLSAIAVAALFQAASAYQGALQQADEMFDYHLQQMALSLRGGPPLAVPSLEDDPNDTDYVIQIWGPNGVQLFRSPRVSLPPQAVLGFSDVLIQGSHYRVYSLQTPQQTIQIAQDMGARLARARALAVRAMLPMALIAPVLMLLLWWAIRHALAPLERTRAQVAVRAAGDLSALPLSGLPDEVRPLVQELNLLFGRVDAAFDAQKSFVAHAAHELRSPLTALKLQAQALARVDATDSTAREVAITRLNQGVDRAILLMNQLLVLARQEGHSSAPTEVQTVVLGDLLRRALADAEPLAQARQITLNSENIATNAMVRGDADALAILLRNLLDNAIKYSPAQGQVRVQLSQNHTTQPPGVMLTVEDSGPGIAPEQRARVFERFFRSPEAVQSASGSGLGLAIVKAIADRHQATVELTSSEALGGLKAIVTFPAA